MKKEFLWKTIGVLGLVLCTGSSWGAQKYQPLDSTAIRNELKSFESNPTKYMNELPLKRNAEGEIVTEWDSLFSPQSVQSKKYVSERDQIRSKMCFWRGVKLICLNDEVKNSLEDPIRKMDAYQGNDLVEDLVDRRDVIRTLEQMERMDLKKAALPEAPWSGDYWATYRGALAARYGDEEFPDSTDWKKNRDYILENPVSKWLGAGVPNVMDRLSPSEKYSLLIGDENHTLSEAIWKDGQRYYDAYGEVETWFGLCHGWAAAAFMLPRPEKSVTIKSADGRYDIKFYPSDLKGLATYLWANWAPPSRLIGGRCNDKTPKLDENGRAVSRDCFDTNPGTWHMAIVNQIGASQRGLVLDATYDYQVWNQPLYSYEYTYFNPQTGEPMDTLEQAKVELSKFTADKFKKYRSPQTHSVVGVAMNVSYMIETTASRLETDSPVSDEMRQVLYLYDVELSSSGEIIGGEWYKNFHPDFLWTPPAGAKARSYLDGYAQGEWDPATQPLPPAQWLEIARAGSKYGMVMGRIIEGLIKITKP